MATTGRPDIATPEGATAAESPLERRRRRADDAQVALDRARAAVADVDARLQANGRQSQDDDAALQRARDEVARLKAALKDGAKDRARLVKERKRLSADATESARKAKAAEAKYDRVVLTEMVRREKQANKSSGGATAGDSAVGERTQPASAEAGQPADGKSAAEGRAGAAAPEASSAGSTRTGAGAAAQADPEPEVPHSGAPVARATAARSTAAAARRTTSGQSGPPASATTTRRRRAQPEG